MGKKHPLDDAFDDEEESRRKADILQLMDEVEMLLLEYYEPTENEQDALSLTTIEIFERLQEHRPSVYYDTNVVAGWMRKHNFVTVNKGDFRLEWLLKKK